MDSSSDCWLPLSATRAAISSAKAREDRTKISHDRRRVWRVWRVESFRRGRRKKTEGEKGGEGRGKAGLQRPSSPSGWRRRFKVRGIRMNYAFGAACVQSCGASLSRRKFLLRFHLARIWISVEPMEKCTGWEVAGEAQANSEDGSLRSSWSRFVGHLEYVPRNGQCLSNDWRAEIWIIVERWRWLWLGVERKFRGGWRFDDNFRPVIRFPFQSFISSFWRLDILTRLFGIDIYSRRGRRNEWEKVEKRDFYKDVHVSVRWKNCGQAWQREWRNLER